MAPARTRTATARGIVKQIKRRARVSIARPGRTAPRAAARLPGRRTPPYARTRGTRPAAIRPAIRLNRAWRRRLHGYGFRVAAWGFILVLVIFLIQIINPPRRITASDETVAALRVPYRATGLLEAYAAKHGVPFAELFTLFCAENEFFPEKNVTYDLSGIEAQYVSDFERIKRGYGAKNTEPYVSMFESLFREIKFFPVPEAEGEESIMYGDSWGIDRNYEGDKEHRGVDILDRENVRGRLQVVSMTDGTVSESGWDDDLGYHVIVTTPGGTGILYAHLDGIAANISPGAAVAGGAAIGRMGDSGGGQSFPVHLHIGINPRAGFAGDDFMINPYPFLRYLEKPTVL